MTAEMQRVLELIGELQACVDAGEWERAARLEAERFRLIRQVVANDEVDVQGKIRWLKELQTLNSEMESSAQEEKDKLSQALRKLHQGRKVGKAYMAAG